MKNLITIFTTLIIAFAVGYFVSSYYNIFKTKKTIEQETSVLLEKIKTVSKLVTVEGYFSEIINYKDYYYYDWWPFRKKALLKVQAKVLVGYDLEGMKIETFPEEKIIVISNLPEPEIIALDHELSYYDISEGTFNYFSTTELSKLNKSARDTILAKAYQSDLMKTAREKGNDMLKLIEVIAKDAGWTVQYGIGPQLPNGKSIDSMQGFFLQPSNLESVKKINQLHENESYYFGRAKRLAG